MRAIIYFTMFIPDDQQNVDHPIADSKAINVNDTLKVSCLFIARNNSGVFKAVMIETWWLALAVYLSVLPM